MLNNLVATYALSQAISQQPAGLSILQPPGSSATPIGSTAAPKDTIPSSSSASNAFKFNVSNAPANAINKLPQTPLVVQSQDQVSQHVPSNPQQHLDKINSSTPTSKKEEHTKRLKAQFEEQQRALRIAYEKSLRDAQEMDENTDSSKTLQASSEPKEAKETLDAKSTSNNSETSSDTISPAEQLKRSYAAHLASLQKAEQEVALKTISKASSHTKGGEGTKANAKGNENSGQKKSEQDQEAGAILLGFLHSLRESFEDAYENKNGKNIPVVVPKPSAQQGASTVLPKGSSEPATHVARSDEEVQSNASKKNRRQKSDPITSLPPFQAAKRKVKPASVTETSSSTSSQPTIDKPSSSQEDSNSDKTGSCSSEDSDKEITASVRSSKGPPRKRLKSLSGPQEFTRENLMAHSKRMDMECGQSSDISSSDD